MDSVSDVLKMVRVTGSIFFNAEFRSPWGFLSPPRERLAATLGKTGADRLAIYHYVKEGAAEVVMEGEPALPLSAGDLVIFPRADRHVMKNGHPGKLQDMADCLPDLLSRGLEKSQLGKGGRVTRFVCGYFCFDPHVERLFLAGIPPMFKVRMRDVLHGGWLENSIDFALSQAGAGRLGANVLLSRLSEALFVDALSGYMDLMPAESKGWLAGARDRVVGAAIAAIHAEPTHPWTVDALARRARTSRSVLTERFSSFLGLSPMSYVAHWRLHLGAQLLQANRRTVMEVAGDVGYLSEAAFNRAFKRQFGVPPARYRRAASLSGR